MAKKSRRERKADNLATPTAPRMSTSATMTPTAPAPVQAPVAPRPVTMPTTVPAAGAPTSRAARPAAVTADAPARIPPKEMIQEWFYVRKDLRHILILAVILFGALVVLSLFLPRWLGY